MRKGHTNNPRGRPRGRSESLPRGAVKAIRAAKLADDKDPQADEALGVILDVMRRPSRYALARLAAARELLDRRRGRPMQGIKLSGKLTLAQLLAGDDEDNPTDGGSD